MNKEIKSPNKAKVVISKNLAAQIQFLNNHGPNKKEWSALLIYRLVKGSIQDLTDVEIIAEGLFPMDYGDSTFTSFEGDGSWLQCFDTYSQVDPMKPEPGWYVGKLHSHVDFGVFHSGTDKNDLYETAPKLPMFLSLIVNYAADTDCQLAIAMEVEETLLSRIRYKLKGWKDKQKKIEKTQNTSNVTYIIDCDVEYEQDQWMKEQCNYLKTKIKQTVIHHSTTPKQEKKTETVYMVRKFVSNKVMSVLPELITLDQGEGLSVKEALEKINAAVAIEMRESYKKAVKIYFVNYWYDPHFFTMSTDEPEVIEAILVGLGLQNGWIVTVLKEAINELKTEYPKLWAFQEPSLVR